MQIQEDLAQKTPEEPPIGVDEELASCFRGRPLPTCQSFWITEAEFGRELIDPTHGDFDGFVVGGEVGWMRNLNSNEAFGGTVGISNLYLTLGPRYRRWLTPSTALDVGLAAAWEPGRVEIAEAQLSIMYRDQVGLWTKATYDFGFGETGLSAGVRVGSQPGLVAYGLGAITFAIYLWRLALAAS